eukprot:PITA_07435
MNSIHLVLSHAASFKWEVHKMDVKSAFLHGDLHEEIYMEQPTGFIQTDSSLVCRVKKSLMVSSKPLRLVLQSKEGISLSQCKYACDLLRHFHMENCKPTPSPFQSGAKLSVTYTSPEVDATLYRQLVGKLLYLTHTRPDLSFAVGLIAQFMQNPNESHWKAAKRILCYVRGYVFTLGSGPITWACKKQSAISLSSAEAEYRGAVEASKEALWFRQILSEFGFQQRHLTTLWWDNQSAVQLCKDPVQYQRSKHIELQMHFIRKLIHDHVLEVQYCSTNGQVADIFTKALTEAKFTKL